MAWPGSPATLCTDCCRRWWWFGLCRVDRLYDVFGALGLRYVLITHHGRLVGMVKKKVRLADPPGWPANSHVAILTANQWPHADVTSDRIAGSSRPNAAGPPPPVHYCPAVLLLTRAHVFVLSVHRVLLCTSALAPRYVLAASVCSCSFSCPSDRVGRVCPDNPSLGPQYYHLLGKKEGDAVKPLQPDIRLKTPLDVLQGS